MSDSLPNVNAGSSSFEPLISDAASETSMKGNRDDVISGFVRMKIRAWRDSGRELQELARLAGFAKSTPSQVLIGTGVGAKTGPRFARAFGYASFDELKSAAWEWWKVQGDTSQELLSAPRPEMDEAVDAVLLLNQGSREQLLTILSAYSHPRFRDRSRDWWIQTLLSELARDRETAREDKAQREAINRDQRVVREANEGRVRRNMPPQTDKPPASSASKKRAS